MDDDDLIAALILAIVHIGVWWLSVSVIIGKWF